jgi:hypothetical protein
MTIRRRGLLTAAAAVLAVSACAASAAAVGAEPAPAEAPALRVCVAGAVGDPGPCVVVSEREILERLHGEIARLREARRMHPARLARMAFGPYRGITIQPVGDEASSSRLTQACGGLARVVSREPEGPPRYAYFTGAEALEQRALELLVERGLADEALLAAKRAEQPRPASMTSQTPLRAPSPRPAPGPRR